MIRLRKIMMILVLSMMFVPAESHAGYTWTGSGHYQIGGEFGYPTSSLVITFDTVTVSIVEWGGVENMYMYDSSSLSVFDEGAITNLYLYENATASLYGAAPLMNLWVDSASTGWVKLYARDVMWFRPIGPEHGGSVAGWWISNNQWFDITLKGDATQGAITRSFIQIVPEPATALIFGIGSLLICSRQRRKPAS